VKEDFSTIIKIQKALEHAGIHFTEDDTGEIGVRLKTRVDDLLDFGVKAPANNLQDDQIAVALLKPVGPSRPNKCGPTISCSTIAPMVSLTVTDEFTKEGLAIVDGRIRSPRVIEVLARLVSARGAPAFLRSDNGPEFVSKAILSWIVAQGIGTALIERSSLEN
jgi:hypothetical protein